MASTPDGNFWVADDGFVVDQIQTTVNQKDSRFFSLDDLSAKRLPVRFRVEGSRKGAYAQGINPMPGRMNYLVGEPASFARNVDRYSEAKVGNLKPGVDARYYFDNGQPRYDLIVKAGFDPEAVSLKVEGAEGVRVLKSGALEVTTKLGTFEQRGLAVYQPTANGNQKISAKYRVTNGNKVSFELGAYDPTKPVVIDPVIWNSFLSGSGGNDFVNDLTINAGGVPYLVGATASTDFPADTELGLIGTVWFKAFAAVLNPDGASLEWATIFGGPGGEMANGVTLDREGGVIVTGETRSGRFLNIRGTTFPKETGTDVFDAFVVKLTPEGDSLFLSARFGGPGKDVGRSISIVGSQAYILGSTSGGFPQARSSVLGTNRMSQSGAGQDVFLAKVNITGGYIYAAVFGGASDEIPVAVKTQGQNVVGLFETGSDGLFPGIPGKNKALAGTRAAILFSANYEGDEVLFGSYLAAAGSTIPKGLAISPAALTVVGQHTPTTANNFPILLPAVRPARGQASYGFVTQFNAGATEYVYSTLLGHSVGNNTIFTSVNGVDMDRYDNAILVGNTNGTRFPLTGLDARNTEDGSAVAPFAVRLDATGKLKYSTYFGSTGEETPTKVNILRNGEITFSGRAIGDPGVTTGAFKTTVGGTQPFVGKLTLPVSLKTVQANPVRFPYYVPVFVALDAQAYEDKVVSLSSDSSLLTLTSSIRIPAGALYNVAKGIISPLFEDLATEVTGELGPVSITVPVNVPAATVESIVPEQVELEGGRAGTALVTIPAALAYQLPVPLKLVDVATGLVLADTAATIKSPLQFSVGNTSARASINVKGVQNDTTVKIVGPKGVESASNFVIRSATPTLLVLSRPRVIGGQGIETTGYLTISSPAPVGGLTFDISAVPGLITGQPTVTVPAGKKTAQFTFQTAAVSVDTNVAVTVSRNGASVSANQLAQAPLLRGFIFDPSIVTGEGTTQGTIAIAGVAPAGGLVINLSVIKPTTGVTVPATVTVPAGENVVSFTATYSKVTTKIKTQIRASLNGKNLDGAFTINP